MVNLWWSFFFALFEFMIKIIHVLILFFKYSEMSNSCLKWGNCWKYFNLIIRHVDKVNYQTFPETVTYHRYKTDYRNILRTVKILHSFKSLTIYFWNISNFIAGFSRSKYRRGWAKLVYVSKSPFCTKQLLYVFYNIIGKMNRPICTRYWHIVIQIIFELCEIYVNRFIH